MKSTPLAGQRLICLVACIAFFPAWMIFIKCEFTPVFCHVMLWIEWYLTGSSCLYTGNWNSYVNITNIISVIFRIFFLFKFQNGPSGNGHSLTLMGYGIANTTEGKFCVTDDFLIY